MSMQTTEIEIVVNGGTHQLAAGASITTLIAKMGLDPHLVAVEINRQLVRRSNFEEHLIESGDRIEIVEFVGGG